MALSGRTTAFVSGVAAGGGLLPNVHRGLFPGGVVGSAWTSTTVVALWNETADIAGVTEVDIPSGGAGNIDRIEETMVPFRSKIG